MSQLIFPFNEFNIYLQENFIVSNSNPLAYDALLDWQKDFGVYPYPKTLKLIGPPSSGKTYLAKIWQYNTKAKVLDLKKDFAEEDLYEFDAFIIEDICNATEYEDNLLHYFNQIHEDHKFLLLTQSHQNPIFNLKDLKSRLNSLNTISIMPPDDDLLKLLIFKTFTQFSLQISAEVIQFLVNRLERNFEVILNNLNRINDYVMLRKRNVTIPLIKEALTI